MKRHPERAKEILSILPESLEITRKPTLDAQWFDLGYGRVRVLSWGACKQEEWPRIKVIHNGRYLLSFIFHPLPEKEDEKRNPNYWRNYDYVFVKDMLGVTLRTEQEILALTDEEFSRLLVLTEAKMFYCELSQCAHLKQIKAVSSGGKRGFLLLPQETSLDMSSSEAFNDYCAELRMFVCNQCFVSVLLQPVSKDAHWKTMESILVEVLDSFTLSPDGVKKTLEKLREEDEAAKPEMDQMRGDYRSDR